MDKARYLVEAHVLGGRSVSELAAAHGVHRSWIYKLLARYRDGGYEALEPRSRRPRSCRHETPPQVVEAIVELRSELGEQGHDAPAATIAYHLAKQRKDVPSLSTIWRILRRQGLVVPEPQKRPRSSLIRFQAELPNEMWQADITHWVRAPAPASAPLPRAKRSSRTLQSGRLSFVRCRHAAHRSSTLAFGRRGGVSAGTVKDGIASVWTPSRSPDASFRDGFTMATRTRAIVSGDGSRRGHPLAPFRRRGALVLACAGERRRGARGERLCG